MESKVIVLQAGDPWLTTRTLRTVGIFTSEEEFQKFANQMLDKGIVSEWGYKSLIGYYGNGRQCDIKDGALLVTTEPLNPALEDVDL